MRSQNARSLQHLLYIFLLLFFMVMTAQAEVWTATSEWTPEWESRYNQWVQENWNIHFFEKPTLADGSKNPYYGLHVDCADTVYSMRIIFAREHQLPFVMQDPTASGKILSHRMSRWDAASPDSRIRSFLNFIYGTASTRSIPNDTYPVAITPQEVRPGGLILTTHKNHHSWTIKEILPVGVPHLIFNSVAGSARTLVWQERKSWPNPEWVFEGDRSPAGGAGFRYWRPQEYLNKPVWQVPGYSEEQYQIPLKKWVAFAQDRLSTQKEDDVSKLQRLVKVACDGIAGRVNVVQEALDYLAKSGNKCMDYATYDNYSTPNRDHRVFDDLMELRRAYQAVVHSGRESQLLSPFSAQLQKIFPMIEASADVETANMTEQSVSEDSICVISPRADEPMDAAEFKRRLFSGRMSNNPLDSFEYRWGVIAGHSDLAQRCESWGDWTPDFSAERIR